MSNHACRRRIVSFVFDLDGITACEWYGCDAAGGLQAVAVTGAQLGLAIATASYEQATLADIAGPNPIGPDSFRLREIKPCCFGEVNRYANEAAKRLSELRRRR
jgi:hypothetical protein